MDSSAMKFLFALFALFALCSAYVVSGDVFYFAERDMSTALVKAYSEEALVGQAVCDRGGAYSLELPAGDYVVTAQYYDQQEKSMLFSSENVTVLGNTRLDLILFPDFEDMPNFTSPDFPNEAEFADVVEPKPALDTVQITVVLAIIAAVLIGAYFLFVRNRQEEEIDVAVEEKLHREGTKEAAAPESGTSAPEEAQKKAKAARPEYDDIEKVMGIIAKQRQISQGDIIRATNFSSAKVSLILKELEKRKKITREKIGRMKIIRARRVK